MATSDDLHRNRALYSSDDIFTVYGLVEVKCIPLEPTNGGSGLELLVGKFPRIPTMGCQDSREGRNTVDIGGCPIKRLHSHQSVGCN